MNTFYKILLLDKAMYLCAGDPYFHNMYEILISTSNLSKTKQTKTEENQQKFWTLFNEEYYQRCAKWLINLSPKGRHCMTINFPFRLFFSRPYYPIPLMLSTRSLIAHVLAVTCRQFKELAPNAELCVPSIDHYFVAKQCRAAIGCNNSVVAITTPSLLINQSDLIFLGKMGKIVVKHMDERLGVVLLN